MGLLPQATDCKAFSVPAIGQQRKFSSGPQSSQHASPAPFEPISSEFNKATELELRELETGLSSVARLGCNSLSELRGCWLCGRGKRRNRRRNALPRVHDFSCGSSKGKRSQRPHRSPRLCARRAPAEGRRPVQQPSRCRTHHRRGSLYRVRRGQPTRARNRRFSRCLPSCNSSGPGLTETKSLAFSQTT